MNDDFEVLAKQLVVENLPLTCSELIRYQSGNGIADSSVLHQIYAICCKYQPQDGAMEETIRLVSQAAMCAIAGSDPVDSIQMKDRMRAGLSVSLHPAKDARN